MPTISDTFRVALGHYNAGRLADAEAACREILAVDSTCADAWHLLGIVAYRSGNREGAKASVERALHHDPANAGAMNSMGLFLQNEGASEEAIGCFRAAVALRPDFYEALNNLGNALKEQGNLAAAVSWYRLALEIAPTRAELHNNLGAALRDESRLDEAEASYREALRLNPAYAEAYSNLGAVLLARGALDDAVAYCKRAVKLNPRFAEAYQNLGSALKEQGKLGEAVACFRQAVAIQPNSAEAHWSLGNALQDQGALRESAQCFRRSIELKPHDPRHYVGLGNTLRDEGRLDEAAHCFERAIELDRNHAMAHFAQSQLMLRAGDFQRGWDAYEWRWKTGQLLARDFRRPQWRGEPLEGSTVLLWTEQGLGDTVQFIRYAALLKEQGATVVVECQKPLVKLLAGCRGIDRVIGQDDELPPFDVQAPLLSLPRIFGTTVETIPNDVPYLHADPALSEVWRERLLAVCGLRIGINWAGCVAPTAYKNRDIPVEYFLPLAEIPGVWLASLQKGRGYPSLALQASVVDFGDKLDAEHGAFMDTAAIMMNLDLVITSDTSVAHLSGALGVPVWVALPFVPDWRWMLERNDSPWYPTMRLFRQKSRGDWAGVFREIEAALRERLRK